MPLPFLQLPRHQNTSNRSPPRGGCAGSRLLPVLGWGRLQLCTSPKGSPDRALMGRVQLQCPAQSRSLELPMAKCLGRSVWPAGLGASQ